MPFNTVIKAIQDTMRKDVGVDGDAQRISQLVWLLFLKIFDDQELAWEASQPDYQSPLASRFRWRRWARQPDGITGDELIEFVNAELFPALKQLATDARVSMRGRVVGMVFEDAYNYMRSGTLLRQVINTIEADLDFRPSGDRHVFNDIYEKILADLQSAGNAGEYYTPRAVTRFVVDMLAPRPGEVVLDPACGTGGFLTCAIEHLKRQAPDDCARLQSAVRGVEKKPLPHMLAITNMMLHGIAVPRHIQRGNTLACPLRAAGVPERVDVIVTNPPFGGVEEDGIEENFPRKYRTRETADLFMAWVMQRLRPDTGRAAVLLPDGFLFGEGVKTTLKRELLAHFNLHTIVRLPKGVFAPYTSIASNILFFESGGPTRDVWFFEHPVPSGYKAYSRSRPLRLREFELEKAWWGGANREDRQPTEHAWPVSVEALAARHYNLDCRNPHQDTVEHGDPEQLMTEYLAITRELQSAQHALKQELMASLEGTA